MSDTDIFISYSREDREAVRKYARALAAKGLKVWWDAALHSGETFDEVIEAQLRAAKAVVVLWSPRSVRSRWVRAEATMADRRNKLLPVIIEPCDRPIIFELAHTIDLSHWDGSDDDPAWQVFLSDLMRLVRPDEDAGPNPEAHKAAAVPTSVAAKPAFETPASHELFDEFEATQFVRRAPTQRTAHWLLHPDSDVPEMQYLIGSETLKIGRGQAADLVLSDAQISRTHCMITLKDDALHIVDLNSTNGTYVDDERIEEETVLPVGSTLRVGNISFVHEVRASERR